MGLMFAHSNIDFKEVNPRKGNRVDRLSLVSSRYTTTSDG